MNVFAIDKGVVAEVRLSKSGDSTSWSAPGVYCVDLYVGLEHSEIQVKGTLYAVPLLWWEWESQKSTVDSMTDIFMSVELLWFVLLLCCTNEPSFDGRFRDIEEHHELNMGLFARW